MDNLKLLVEKIIKSQSLIEATLSNIRIKDKYIKVVLKPINLKNNLCYQFNFYYDKKVTHQNLDELNTIIKLNELLSEFKQIVLFTKKADIHILISKKFKVNILNKKPTKQLTTLEHNRTKKYLIEETPVDFLIELGIMSKEGKVFAKKYDKFKQINRFLEMIEDITPNLKKDKELTIIDFGCGKSYLTFAIYYYLKLKGFDINIIGLDLKEDVINNCNLFVKKLGWNKLNFFVGDIAGYLPKNDIDMVVTLHACDTATDFAIEKAIEWNAEVILSVPCCQHELNSQIKNEILNPMLKYGLLKERFSALATDAIRANILEISGYTVQILEFIDMEHTPKNILIRAVKDKKYNNEQKLKDYIIFKEFLNANLYLDKIVSKL